MRPRYLKFVHRYLVKRTDTLTGIVYKFGPIVSCPADIKKDANRLCRELPSDIIQWVAWGKVSEYDKKDAVLPEDR